MAPKIKVPADFGREHINSPVHGNLVLKLRDGHEIKTNSMIMSLNSPVIDNLTTNLTQSSLEMEDFTKEAVDCFVESLYTGEVESLKKQIFEDVNKMAHVFEVSWLSKRCLRFYKNVVLNYEKNSFQEILFACEIASRADHFLNQNRFVSLFIKDLMPRDFSRTLFLQRYMANFAELSKRQIDMSIRVSGNDSSIIMILNSHLTMNLKSKSIDQNSLYLLQHLDMREFSQNHPILFKDTADLMLEISEGLESSEVRNIVTRIVQHKDGSYENDFNEAASSIETVEESSDCEISDDEDFHYPAAVEYCWIKAESEENYKLVYGNSIQLLTTGSESNRDVNVHFRFLPENEGSEAEPVKVRHFGMRSNPWGFKIEGCTDHDRYDARSIDVDILPSDKVKHWIITKTSRHLIVKCNKVTVVKFNFLADSDYDKKESCKLWSNKVTTDFMLKHDWKALFILNG